MTDLKEIVFTERAYGETLSALDRGPAYLLYYPTKGPNWLRFRVWHSYPERNRYGRGKVLKIRKLSQLEHFDAVKIMDFPLLYVYTDPEPLNRKLRDRSIRAYGEHMERTINNLTVGIVGAGKTGSAVAELLLMEGIKNLVVVDFDQLEVENQEYMTPGWFKKGIPKAYAIKGFARNFNAEVIPVVKDILVPYARYKLRDCDLVFCCTDRALPRLVLSYFCSRQLIPMVDTGIAIEAGNQPTARGQIQLAIPGRNCLLCIQGINIDQCRQELEAAREGKEISEPMPSEVAFSRTMASLAVLQMKNLFVGMSPLSFRINVRMDREGIRVQPANVDQMEYCPICSPWWVNFF